MKGNKKILIAILLLLIISLSFSTLAIYRSSANGTGTVSAAGWSVKVNGTDIESATLDFSLAGATRITEVGKNGKVAPGDSFSKTFTVDATGSEVDVIVTAEIDDTQVPSGWTATATVANGGVINYAASGMTADVTVTVTWAGDINDDAGKDTADKLLAGEDVTLPISLTARQKVAGE